MTDSTPVKQQLERLAQRGRDPGAEWLIASVRRELAQAELPVAASSGTRRAWVVAAVAFTAVMAIVVAAVAFGSHNGPTAPSNSTPATRSTSPNPTTTDTMPTQTTFVPPVPVTRGQPSVAATTGEPALFSKGGWVCGSPLQYTNDGGTHWRAIALGVASDVDGPCAFASGGRAWKAVGGAGAAQAPVVVRVVVGDRPEVTRVRLPVTDPAEYVRSLAFADAQHGWALTARQNYSATGGLPSTLYATTDGGAHWQRLLSDAPVSGGLTFTNARTGFGFGGEIERTDDGGRTWTRLPIVPMPDYGGNLKGALISLFAFGDRIVANGFVPTGNFGQLFFETSNDDGAHWSLQVLPADVITPAGTLANQFVAVDATNWRFGQGTALFTTDDAGKSWHQRTSRIPVVQLTGISFLTPDIGWAVDCSNACSAALTIDGGTHWKLLGATTAP